MESIVIGSVLKYSFRLDGLAINDRINGSGVEFYVSHKMNDNVVNVDFTSAHEVAPRTFVCTVDTTGFPVGQLMAKVTVRYTPSGEDTQLKEIKVIDLGLLLVEPS